MVPLDVELPQTTGLLPRKCSQHQPELVLGQGAGGEVHRLKVDDEVQVVGEVRTRLEVLKSWEPVQVIVLPRPEQLFSILIIFEHISVLTEIEVLERGGRML